MSDWGIYRAPSGISNVFDVDSFVDLKPQFKTKTSSFPVEKGGFADYNKVQEPIKIKIRLAVSGKTRMKALIGDLQDEMFAANLFNVTTPMQTYLNVTLETFDYSQTSGSNLGMLIANLSFVEIRQVDTGQYTSVIVIKKAKKAEIDTKEVTGKTQVRTGVVIKHSLGNAYAEASKTVNPGG